MTMRSLLDVFFESLQKRRLIDQQINVYMAWIEKHHGWNMLSDKKWLDMFAEQQCIRDVDEIKRNHFDGFMETVGNIYQTRWARKEARMAILRFVRFYEARTKSFTKSPRRGVSETFPQETLEAHVQDIKEEVYYGVLKDR